MCFPFPCALTPHCSHYRKQQSPSELVTPGPSTAGVPFADATLRTAFDLGAVAASLDPHFAEAATGWRALFNGAYAVWFPAVPGHLPTDVREKPATFHIRRLLKNLCWFEYQLLQEHAGAAVAAAAPAAAAPAAAEDDAMEEDVIELSDGALYDGLKAKMARYTRSFAPVRTAPAPAPAQPRVSSPWSVEVDRFLDSFVIPKQFTEDGAPLDPLEMWAELRGEFPLLSRVAQRVFGVAATSAEAERVFSTAGLVATDDRSSLKPEKLCALVFLARTLRTRAVDAKRRAALHAARASQ